MVTVKKYPEPQFNIKEAYRYAGCKESFVTNEVAELMNECINEMSGKFQYKVCYDIFDIKIGEPDIADDKLSIVVEKENKFLSIDLSEDKKEIKLPTIDLGFTSLKSKDLAKNLKGCSKVIIFAATVGLELDRCIRKYNTLAPAKALMLQGLGAERVESLCDLFCDEMAREYDKEGLKLKPRYSPGYGDVSLEFQHEIFRILDPYKNIGISLNDSLLMTPSKSVTAFVGIYNNKLA